MRQKGSNEKFEMTLRLYVTNVYAIYTDTDAYTYVCTCNKWYIHTYIHTYTKHYTLLRDINDAAHEQITRGMKFYGRLDSIRDVYCTLTIIRNLRDISLQKRREIEGKRKKGGEIFGETVKLYRE